MGLFKVNEWSVPCFVFFKLFLALKGREGVLLCMLFWYVLLGDCFLCLIVVGP